MGRLVDKIKKMNDTRLLMMITIVIFVLMYAGAVIFQGGGFRKPQNLFNMLNANAALIILSVGMSIVMVCGSIDISVRLSTALLPITGLRSILRTVPEAVLRQT